MLASPQMKAGHYLDDSMLLLQHHIRLPLIPDILILDIIDLDSVPFESSCADFLHSCTNLDDQHPSSADESCLL